MSGLVLNGLKTCDTVKKARAWLDTVGLAYRFRDFKAEPPASEEIAAWAGAVGWEKLLNRAGTTFRALPEADKADLTAEKAITLMAAHPSLIKRPVVEGAKTLLVGFTPAAYAAALDG